MARQTKAQRAKLALSPAERDARAAFQLKLINESRENQERASASQSQVQAPTSKQVAGAARGIYSQVADDSNHLPQPPQLAGAATPVRAAITSASDSQAHSQPPRAPDEQSTLRETWARFKDIEARVDKNLPFTGEAYLERPRRICEAVSPYLRDQRDIDARQELVEEHNCIFDRYSQYCLKSIDDPSSTADGCLQKAISDHVSMRQNRGRGQTRDDAIMVNDEEEAHKPGEQAGEYGNPAKRRRIEVPRQ